MRNRRRGISVWLKFAKILCILEGVECVRNTPRVIIGVARVGENIVYF